MREFDVVGGLEAARLSELVAIRRALNNAGLTATPRQLLDTYENAKYAVRIRRWEDTDKTTSIGWIGPIAVPLVTDPDAQEAGLELTRDAALRSDFRESDLKVIPKRVQNPAAFYDLEALELRGQDDPLTSRPVTESALSEVPWWDEPRTTTMRKVILSNGDDGSVYDYTWYDRLSDALIAARTELNSRWKNFVSLQHQQGDPNRRMADPRWDRPMERDPFVIEIMRAPTITVGSFEGHILGEEGVKYGELTMEDGVMKWEVFLENLVGDEEDEAVRESKVVRFNEQIPQYAGDELDVMREESFQEGFLEGEEYGLDQARQTGWDWEEGDD